MISLELLAVAIALGCDAFSVAIGVGSRRGLTKRRIFRLTFHFGLFQFFMPLIGLGIGQIAAVFIGRAGHRIAALCLAVIGINMIRTAWKNGYSRQRQVDPSKGWSLVILSISTSIDALVAGFGLGLLGMKLLFSCIVIGITAALMTFTGMIIGACAYNMMGRWAEIFGGVVLIVLAVIFIL